ncbi:MAG: 4Fe-4S binding protein, partial [Nitrospinota bacterium]
MAQALRRIIQTLSLLLILMLPLLGLAAALYQAYGPHGGHLAWVAGGRGHWLLHGALEKLSELGFEPSALPESFTGTLWSLRLFGLELADPLAALSFSLSAGEIYTPLLAAVLIPLGLAFLMGRAFCGWACPVNTLGELAHGLRARLEGRGLLRAYDFSFSRSNKYFLLLAGLTATFLSGYSLIHLLLPYLALGRGVYLYVFFGSLSVALALPLGILLFEFFISRRGWCRYFCPAGGLLALIGRVSLLRVEGKENMSCPPSCVSCLESCGMGLNPRAERLWPECHFCLRCISSCPKSLIGVRVAPIGRTALGAFVILLVIFFSFSLARAHHIMGLPHYGYADNYPQVPSKEHVLREGPYTVYAVCFFF